MDGNGRFLTKNFCGLSGVVFEVGDLQGNNYKVEHVPEYSQKAMSVIEEPLREEEDKSKL